MLTLFTTAAWKVAAISLLVGAGLPALFAVGIRTMAYGAGGDAEIDHAPGHLIGKIGGVLIFALVLAFILTGIAIIVASDVGGRASGSVAQYQARSAVAVSVLELSLAAHRNAPAGEAGTSSAGGVVWAVAIAGALASVLRKATGVVGQLSGIRGNAEGQPEVQITRSDGTREWCTPDELELRELTF